MLLGDHGSAILPPKSERVGANMRIFFSRTLFILDRAIQIQQKLICEALEAAIQGQIVSKHDCKIGDTAKDRKNPRASADKNILKMKYSSAAKEPVPFTVVFVQNWSEKLAL